MKHLTDEQLSARLDRALTGRTHEEAERHLAECAQCRNALAALAAQDRFLGAALVHDPGEEYFASFAARVEDRLRADGIRGAQARLRDDHAPWLRWFNAPRRVAWAGAVATVVAGAAIVLITTREDRVPRMPATEFQSHALQSGPAPAPPETPPSDVVGSSEPSASPTPSPAGRKQADRLADARAKERDAKTQTPVVENLQEGTGASPARMRQAGAPASTPVPQIAEPSAPVAPAPEGRGVRVMKRNTAVPMQSKDQASEQASQSVATREEESAPAPETMQARDQAPAEKQKAGAAPTASAFAPPPSAAGLAAGGNRSGEVQLCGQVLDTEGRPVAHASVALVTLGRTATSGESGSFCMSAPDGSYELSVMAVGFEPSRMQVKVAGERSDVRVTLAAISVMDGLAKAPAARLDAGEPVKLNATTGSTKAEPKTDAKKTTTPTSARPAPKDPFAGESKASAQAAATAMAATRYAATYPTVPTWSKAAGLWGVAAEAVKTPSGRAEALYRIAEARVNVWRQYPTPTRKNDALFTCMTVISGTPTPEQRKDAMKWAAEVRRGPTGRD